MFSTFCLYALFSSEALRNITFETLGYDSENVLLDDTIYHASSVDGLVTTGKSLIGPDGVENPLVPVTYHIPQWSGIVVMIILLLKLLP